MLEDIAQPTPVEQGDGHLPAVRAKGKTGRLSSAKELAEIFDECVMPAHLAVGTRESYQSYWKSVITWAIAHDEVGSILPMTQTTLKAITQELMMIGCATGTIRNVWSAIEDRHRRFGYPLPLGMQGDFTRMGRAVASVQGQPSRLIFPVRTHHVKAMLEMAGLTDSQTRDILMCVLGTVACLRVREIAQPQVCDLRWNHDAAWHSRRLALQQHVGSGGLQAQTRPNSEGQTAASSAALVRGVVPAHLCSLVSPREEPQLSQCHASR